MTRYEQGFLSKCAEYGINGSTLLSLLYKSAQATNNPVVPQQEDDMWGPTFGSEAQNPWAPPVAPVTQQKQPQQPVTLVAQQPQQPVTPVAQPKHSQPSYTKQQQSSLNMWKAMNYNQKMQWLYDHGVDPYSFSKLKGQDKTNAFLNATNARRSAGSLPWTPPQGKMRRTGIFQGGKEVMLDSRGKFRAQNGISGSAQSQGNLSKVWIRNRNQTGL